MTTYALAEREGMSQGHLSRRLARARRYRLRWEEEERRARDAVVGVDGPPDDRDDLRYVALTAAPQLESGEYYDLDTDECSLDSGLIRIGDHNGRRLQVRSVTGGVQTDSGGPTKYDPDPDLKGGVG